jgi:hypothetical protein
MSGQGVCAGEDASEHVCSASTACLGIGTHLRSKVKPGCQNRHHIGTVRPNLVILSQWLQHSCELSMSPYLGHPLQLFQRAVCIPSASAWHPPGADRLHSWRLQWGLDQLSCRLSDGSHLRSSALHCPPTRPRAYRGCIHGGCQS